MPFDREGTLRTAEKLVRQGKLDGAIAQYRRVIDDQPNDWNTTNTLGDLYFRTGQIDRAAAEYERVADYFANAGFYSKAVALYRKILKIKPNEERAMWYLGVLGARQGLLVDARANFLALVGRRRARGDARGVAEARVELGDLDGADIETRIEGARARAELGEITTAVLRLKQCAADLQEQGKDDTARQLLTEAARLGADVAVPEVAAAAPRALWTVAEAELRHGRIAEGMVALQQILSLDPSRRGELVVLGCSVAEVNPDAGLACVELAASAAIAADEWGSAADALNEFVTRVPGHIPALMRLVEICVDGGLEAPMHSAQAQLADAYLIVGAGAEARVIAEDLVARQPWEHAHIERFRQALTLLGEDDIDAVIARRLSGQSPFTSTDFLPPEDEEIDLSAIVGVLQNDEAERDPSPEIAEQHLKLAASFLQMNLPSDATKALEVAARSVRHRFRASGMLAQIYLDRGDRKRAIEWYERAAEAPAPDSSAHHALLYDLAAVLQAEGEHARALAVFLQLQTEAEDYRDLTARLEHLTAELNR